MVTLQNHARARRVEMNPTVLMQIKHYRSAIYLAYDSLPDYPYKASRFAQRYNQKYQPSIHRAELVPKHAHTYLQEYQTKVPAI